MFSVPEICEKQSKILEDDYKMAIHLLKVQQGERTLHWKKITKVL